MVTATGRAKGMFLFLILEIALSSKMDKKIYFEILIILIPLK